MITLVHDYVVDVDSSNYVLMVDKHKLDKNGCAVFQILGYYSNLENAIVAAREDCNKRRLGNGTHSLTEAIEIIKKTKQEFIDLLEGNDDR